MGLTDITDLKNTQVLKPVPLKLCNCTLCQSLLSEVLLGLLLSVLKRQKVAHFPRAEAKTVGHGYFNNYIKPKNCRSAS